MNFLHILHKYKWVRIIMLILIDLKRKNPHTVTSPVLWDICLTICHSKCFANNSAFLKRHNPESAILNTSVLTVTVFHHINPKCPISETTKTCSSWNTSPGWGINKIICARSYYSQYICSYIRNHHTFLVLPPVIMLHFLR